MQAPVESESKFRGLEGELNKSLVKSRSQCFVHIGQ